MTSSILPFTHRKPTPEETERHLPVFDHTDASDAYPACVGITATTLSRTTHCLLRAVWSALGEKGIAPSPFTQASLEDGKAFEKSC